MNLAALSNGGGGVLRRQALALKNDPEGSGKYIAGLKEIRVRSREVSFLRRHLCAKRLMR
jgi:kinesin family protein 20